ncbi:MAG: DNA polymerase subunit beta [Candidatus Latescibacteria bacterium]|nr:DNA polymerase subunit beta [Candidatus Latescibacterota bacterium]
MPLDKRLIEKRVDIHRIAQNHGVGSILVFGSAARGEMVDSSDVDFLIEVQGPTTPWFPGGLVADLEALLGCRVDVVETQSLNQDIKELILEEATAL